MKTKLLISVILSLIVSSSSWADNITLKMKNVSVEDAIASLNKTGNYSIVVKTSDVDLTKIISVNANNATLEEVMGQILIGQDVEFAVEGNKISISKNSKKQIIVSGHITSQNGETLIGASVIVKNETSRGVVTDLEGNFSIPAEKGEILVVDCLGYVSKEITVSSNAKMNIALSDDTKLLDEVVVVGYSPMRKSDFTGSLSSVKADELPKTTATVGQSLVGRLAGVEVRQSSGAPGAGVDIRVRGVNSLSASAAPLYVIDGYPASEDAYINPNDIESIDVLKDAASAAIYGSRASSGVVLITTKRGKESDKIQVSYDFSYGWQNLERKIDLLNAEEFAQLYVDARNNSYRVYCNKAGVAYDPKDNNTVRMAKVKEAGAAQTAVCLAPYVWDFNTNSYASTAFKYKTDWQDVTFAKNAGMMRHNISVTGGSKKIQYMASIGYLKQDGILAPSDHNQINARLNLDGQVSKKIAVAFNYSMYSADSRNASHSGRMQDDGVVQSILGSVPIAPAYYEDGTIASSYQMYISKWDGVSPFTPTQYNTSATLYGFSAYENPLTILNNIESQKIQQRHNLSGSLTYEIINGLKFKVMAGSQWFTSTEKYYRGINVGYDHKMAGDPRLEANQHYATSKYNGQRDALAEFTLNYKKDFNKHHIDFLGGYTAQKKTYDTFGLKATSFPDDRIHDISYASDKNAVSEYGVDRNAWTLASWLARANYSYDNRYTITGSFRADGCSRFGANSKWGFFPSISAGWAFSNEPWMENVKNIVSGRLRASYGVSGNNNIGNYSAYSMIASETTSIGGTLVGTNYESAFVDEDLSWETTKQLNLGLDLNFFNGRLNLIGNYYNSITTNVLYSVPIPASAGYTTTTTNLSDGKIRNRGFDLQVDARIFQGAFNWKVGANVSVNRNVVLSLGGVDDILTTTQMSSQTHITKVGYPIGSFLAFKTMGIMSEADYQNTLKDREVYVGNGNKFPADYKLKGPAVPSYSLEYMSAGNVIYHDVNGDNTITNDDREIVGNAYPKFTGGFNTTMEYRGFDLAMAFSFSYGGKLMNFTNYYIYNLEGSSNQYGVVRERYRSEEEPGNGEVPIAFRHGNKNTGMKVSDRYVEDGSYFRISNISLGYNFPTKLLEKIKISGLRVFVNGDNIFTFTKYRGYNPEVDFNSSNLAPGFDWGCYPLARTITTGLKITF